MRGPLEDVVKRWTAKRKSALVIEIIQGKTTVAEASRSFDLSPSEIEGWVDDARRGMENALRTNPLDVRQEYEKQLHDLRGRPMARPCWNCAPEKSWRPSWSGRIEPWLRHWFEKPWRGIDPDAP